jgi:hypothetical protein
MYVCMYCTLGRGEGEAKEGREEEFITHFNNAKKERKKEKSRNDIFTKEEYFSSSCSSSFHGVLGMA